MLFGIRFVKKMHPLLIVFLGVVLIGTSIDLLAEELNTAGNTLMLREEAYVKGPQVRLGDVADIIGSPELVASLADIELTSAAQPGGSKRVNATLIEARLRNAGISTDVVTLKGANSIQARTLYHEISRHEVVASLQEFIEMDMPWEPSIAEIVIPTPNEDFIVPEGDVSITWNSNPSYQYLGAGTFRGSIEVDGVMQRSILVRADVDAYVEVLTVATDIPRGRPISISDLEIQRQALSKVPSGVLTSPDEAIGMISRRTLFPGMLLTNRNIEAPVVVRRNQVVPVLLKSGALTVQAQGRALANGRVGDLINCANLNSREEFQGIVRQDGVVVVH